MKEDLIKLKRMLSRVKPWIAVAAVLATLIVGYYAVIGAQYLKVSQESPALAERIRQLTRGARGEAPEEHSVEAQLESLQMRLENLRDLFSYPQTDDLMAIMTDTASAIPLTLRSIAIGDANPETLNEIQFQAQPVNVTVKGRPESIYKFIALLQKRIPVIAVTSIRLTDIDAKPTGQIAFVVYLSPESTAGDEAS